MISRNGTAMFGVHEFHCEFACAIGSILKCIYFQNPRIRMVFALAGY